MEQVVFSDIMPALEAGAADFGVCIHEGRFTWRAHGLALVEDLGSVWEKATAAPLPLGGILARHALGADTIRTVSAVIRDSLAHARAHRGETVPTMRRYAQELTDDVLFQHVDLFTVSGPEGYLAARDLAEDNLFIGHTVIVDSVNPVAITRDYWRETAARLTVKLVEIEVVCSDGRQHRQRVESRSTDIPGLVLPTWQQVLDRHYEPWKNAHVVDTAGRTLEDTLSQAEEIVRRKDR